MNRQNPRDIKIHQYIDRVSGRAVTETLTADPVIQAIYTSLRENAGKLFNLLISGRVSALLGAVAYDLPLRPLPNDPDRFRAATGIDLSETVRDPGRFTSYREIFERQIRYWDLRPMAKDPGQVVSPADARVLAGSFSDTTALFVKGKFFEFNELVGPDKYQWQALFHQGDYAVFRLTPEKYHYNHTPVSGQVLEIYEIEGRFHSCNPGAVVRAVTPYSKNRRVVTIIDTDVPGGTGVGLVAMVEVVAMMIGRITQCYSARQYATPVPVAPGLFLEKGRPKSLFRPGSSTTILMFEPNRIRFCPDILANLRRSDVVSRFTRWAGHPLVETEVQVRSPIGRACPPSK